jgi:hypothetical protein
MVSAKTKTVERNNFMKVALAIAAIAAIIRLHYPRAVDCNSLSLTL